MSKKFFILCLSLSSFCSSAAHAAYFGCEAQGDKYWYSVYAEEFGLDRGQPGFKNPSISVREAGRSVMDRFFIDDLILARLIPYTQYISRSSTNRLSVTIGQGNIVKVWHEDYGPGVGASSYDCIQYPI